jgi:hypothetical protein
VPDASVVQLGARLQPNPTSHSEPLFSIASDNGTNIIRQQVKPLFVYGGNIGWMCNNKANRSLVEWCGLDGLTRLHGRLQHARGVAAVPARGVHGSARVAWDAPAGCVHRHAQVRARVHRLQHVQVVLKVLDQPAGGWVRRRRDQERDCEQ